MTSKLGAETRAGRATIVKVLGEDGDAVVSAFKSAAAKLDSRAVAKEKKRDAIRLVLKAYNLWRRKDLTAESTRELQTEAQLFGEMFARDAGSPRARGARPVAHLAAQAKRVTDSAVRALRPFLRDKNVAALSDVLAYFASSRFVDALLNDERFEEECRTIEHSVSQMLSSLQPVLLGESEKATLKNQRELLRILSRGERMRIEQIVEYPSLVVLFQEMLDLEMGLASRNSLRFFLAVRRDFERVSTRSVLKIRAEKILDKFLADGEFKVGGVPPATADAVRRALESGSVTSSLFEPVVTEIRGALEDDFYHSFVTSEDFNRYRAKLAADVDALEARLRAHGTIVGPPSAAPSPAASAGAKSARGVSSTSPPSSTSSSPRAVGGGHGHGSAAARSS